MSVICAYHHHPHIHTHTKVTFCIISTSRPLHMQTETKQSWGKLEEHFATIYLPCQILPPRHVALLCGQERGELTLELSESYLWLNRQHVKTYELYCICHFFCSRLSVLLFIQFLLNFLQNLFHFKLKIIVRHMSCTMEIRHSLPLCKIFQ